MVKKDAFGNTEFDFDSAIVCDLEQMLRDKAIESVRSFFKQVFDLAKKKTIQDSAWALSDKQGIRLGTSAIKEAALSVLPKMVGEFSSRISHFAIRNITAKK